LKNIKKFFYSAASILGAAALGVGLFSMGTTSALWQDRAVVDLGEVRIMFRPTMIVPPPPGGGFGEGNTPSCWLVYNSTPLTNTPYYEMPIKPRMGPNEFAIVSLDLRQVQLAGHSGNNIRLDVTVGGTLFLRAGDRTSTGYPVSFVDVQEVILVHQGMAEAFRAANPTIDPRNFIELVGAGRSGESVVAFRYTSRDTGQVNIQPNTRAVIGVAVFNQYGELIDHDEVIRVVPGIGGYTGGSNQWVNRGLDYPGSGNWTPCPDLTYYVPFYPPNNISSPIWPTINLPASVSENSLSDEITEEEQFETNENTNVNDVSNNNENENFTEEMLDAESAIENVVNSETENNYLIQEENEVNIHED